MAKYHFNPRGTCSRAIEFEIDSEGKIHNLSFVGGCDGNTKGICALAEGQPAENVRKVLSGIDCRGRGTSCPDQLSRAIDEALKIG